ncbi:MAG: LemA family protein [Flavobacteriaceae bacterium]|nr:LemA family protein [Flavobacteriaceae bacterium]
MNNSWLIPLLILIFVLIWGLSVYNQLVNLRNLAKNAFSNIDVMLKKRYDLIPQLVQTVKAYMTYEKEILENITTLRNQAIAHDNSENQKVQINNQLSDAIGNLMLSVEAYPELKASKNFLHLQRSIAEVEEQLSASRRSYNMAITQLNTKTESIPSNLIANWFGFERKPLFKATATEKKQIDVSISTSKN